MADNRGEGREGRNYKRKGKGELQESGKGCSPARKRARQVAHVENEIEGEQGVHCYRGHEDISKEEMIMLRSQGSRLCTEAATGSALSNDKCVLLKKHGRSRLSLLEEIQKLKNLECARKGSCKKECQGSCRRFAAYQLTAKRLKLKARSPLPICVRAVTEELYGQSQTGYLE